MKKLMKKKVVLFLFLLGFSILPSQLMADMMFYYETMILPAIVHKDKNSLPVADAGEDKMTEVNQGITISGSGTDSDGSIVAYEWTLNGVNVANSASFTYTPNSVGDKTFVLTVTDDDGAQASDSMVLHVTDSTANQAPVADAGEDKTTEVNQGITISGSGTDSDGSIVAYEWKEGNMVLSTESEFDYIPTERGVHVLTLTVTDDDGAKGSDVVRVVAQEKRPLLIIRIEFNDYQFRSSVSVWSEKIFGYNNAQLNSYYNEVSYGSFVFDKVQETEGTLNDGIVTVHFNENHPGNTNDFDGAHFPQAIEEADQYVDFSQYDIDGSGGISKDELQVMFLIAGGESATGAAPGVWAHAWCFYGGNGNAPTVDGVKVMDCSSNGWFSRFGEKHFDADNGADATVGIIAHELGHACLSLPDLYDTDGSSEGIGNFGLMGGGSWGYQSGESPGTTPVHMTGWSKVASKFIKAVDVSSVQGLQLHATASEDYILYKIPTGVDKEYFLIENRAAEGYDRGLYPIMHGNGDYEGGLLVLHIDDNQDNNRDETHKWVDIEEANNPVLDDKTSRGDYRNLFYEGNQNSFTEVSEPNSDTYNNGSSGVNITNISTRGNTMSADISIN